MDNKEDPGELLLQRLKRLGMEYSEAIVEMGFGTIAKTGTSDITTVAIATYHVIWQAEEWKSEGIKQSVFVCKRPSVENGLRVWTALAPVIPCQPRERLARLKKQDQDYVNDPFSIQWLYTGEHVWCTIAVPIDDDAGDEAFENNIGLVAETAFLANCASVDILDGKQPWTP